MPSLDGFVTWEHQRAGALADHQAVAPLVERARRSLRGRVERLAGGVEHVEHRGVTEVELLGAAAHHDVGKTGADGLEAMPDGLGRAHAGRRGADHATSDAEIRGEVRRRCVAHELEKRRRGQPEKAVLRDQLAHPVLVGL